MPRSDQGFTVKATQKDLDFLRLLAEEENETLAHLVRHMMDYWLEKQGYPTLTPLRTRGRGRPKKAPLDKPEV